MNSQEQNNTTSISLKFISNMSWSLTVFFFSPQITVKPTLTYICMYTTIQRFWVSKIFFSMHSMQCIFLNASLLNKGKDMYNVINDFCSFERSIQRILYHNFHQNMKRYNGFLGKRNMSPPAVWRNNPFKILSSLDLFSYLCSVIQFSAWAAWVVVLKLHHVWTQRQEENQSLVYLRLTFNYPLQHRQKCII